MSQNRFRPRERLKRPSDFKQVYDRRCSASDPVLLVYGCDNELPYSRVGLSVSRKLGGAVVRARLKRLLRETFRLCRTELPVGLDYVLIPRNPETVSLDRLKQSLPRLARDVVRKLSRNRKP